MSTPSPASALRSFEFVNGRLECEGVAAEELVAAYGTPLYVYSATTMKQRYDELDEAFAAVDHLIAYSVKANGNLSLLRILASRGAGADVVSAGELYRVRAAGIPADRIVFSGVGKTVTELAAALDAGIYGFNVESEGELRALSALAATMGTTARIAVRVNPDVHASSPHHYIRTGHAETKFGVPYADALDIYDLAVRLPGIRVVGVDMHIGSQILEAAPYAAAIERLADLVTALRVRDIRLEYVDIGGGFGIAYDANRAPAAADFASGIMPLLRRLGLRVVLEPGRFIAGPAGILLTRVLYTKEGPTKTFVITDAGMNDLLRPSHYSSYHHVAPAVRNPDRGQRIVDIVGPICETGDFLALDREIEIVRPGELLMIGEAGAYGFAMASTYNSRPRPAEVLVSGGDHRLIRRRETLEDLVRGELDILERGDTH